MGSEDHEKSERVGNGRKEGVSKGVQYKASACERTIETQSRSTPIASAVAGKSEVASNKKNTRTGWGEGTSRGASTGSDSGGHG